MWCAEQIVNDFKQLIKEGNIAVYARCEVTEIFLLDKPSNKVSNIYTLVSFEDAPSPHKDPPKFLTESPIPLGNEKNYSYGILRSYLNLSDAKKILSLFLKSGKWSLKEGELIFGDLKFLPKQFIPPSSDFRIVPLNSILKNNFYNGSYIIEGFDEKKSHVKILLDNPSLLLELSENVQKILPIALGKLSDRLGNIILQFPINILHLTFEAEKGNSSLRVNLHWQKVLERKRDVGIISLNEFDKVYQGFGLKTLANEHSIVEVGNSYKSTTNLIVDYKENLILSYFSRLNREALNFNVSMRVGNHEPRAFSIVSPSGETEKHRINVFNAEGRRNCQQELDYYDYVQQRLFANEKVDLEKTLAFKQYAKGLRTGTTIEDERIQALNDVRLLINQHGEEGVYLWDPYLSAIDILETLFFCQFAHTDMKAISSYNTKKKVIYAELMCTSKEELGFNEWKTQQQEGLSSSKNNNYGIKMEFRVQHAHGWKFHDRFLIFPKTQEKAKAWSLGTSVNSLGREHHILQEVSNAEHIHLAFLELWKALDKPESKVWSSPC